MPDLPPPDQRAEMLDRGLIGCPVSFNGKHSLGYPEAAVCPFCRQKIAFVVQTLESLKGGDS